QRALAEEVTTLVHGQEETRRAIAASRALFGQGSLTDLDERTLAAVAAEVRAAAIPGNGGLPPVAHPMAAAGGPPPAPAARPPRHRRRRRLPEQPEGRGREGRPSSRRPAARPLPDPPPRQAHGRSGRSGSRGRLAPARRISASVPSAVPMVSRRVIPR